MKQGKTTNKAILLLLLGAINYSSAQGAGLTGEEIENIYSRLSTGGNVTLEKMNALNNSKVTVRVKQRTPLYAKPSKSSRVVDHIGANTNYTWRCYPAKKGSKWMRCASDEFIFIE